MGEIRDIPTGDDKMKVHLAGRQEGKVGGGWTFLDNLAKGGIDVSDYAEADAVFISGASMVRTGLVDTAKKDGKKIILRVDNALKSSRNKCLENGMGKMEYIAKHSDLVIYQCRWAKDYLHDFLGKPNSAIIYNGIDMHIYSPTGDKYDFGGNSYLYSCASKGETKRWHWAWWRYQQIQKENPKARLLVTGNLSTPVLENGLDFFQGERYTFFGMVRDKQELAKIYRSAKYFFAVYENDCYSNTYLEALASGCELIDISMTGGTPELLENWGKGREYNSTERMVADYKKALEGL